MAVAVAEDGNRRAALEDLDVSIVMPCLNEEATLGASLRKAREGLARLGVRGEVIVADNGSTDRSIAIAESEGARVVHVSRRGYGSAYQGGIAAARGRVIVIGDSDDTYDFSRIDELIAPLEHGADLVMGSRLGGTIAKGAMPPLHRYVGTPVLTAVLNLLFGTKLVDTLSGFRAFTRRTYEALALSSPGMEWGSEMLVAAARKGLNIVEVPIQYHPRLGESKLRSFRDGWRYLRMMLMYSPTHLFIMPGVVMTAVGLLILGVLMPGPIRYGRLFFDFHYMFVGSLGAIIGTQVALLGLFAKSEQGMPAWFTLERGLVFGALLLLAGFAVNFRILWVWVATGFGPMNAVRPAIVALTLMAVGAQIFFSSFYLALLPLHRRS